VRILVADDEWLSRAGLVKLVEERGDEVVGQARDGFEALEQARALRPDVVLMGIRMRRCDGFEATRLIRAELSQIEIVVVASEREGGDVLESLRSAVAGCVPRDRPEPELTRVLDGLATAARLEGVTSPVGKENQWV
jgi:DNA-binding NarL/FixJ family response regulator